MIYLMRIYPNKDIHFNCRINKQIEHKGLLPLSLS